MPNNIVLLPLAPYFPELNSMENVWEYLRGNKLSAGVWGSYEAIAEACAEAWNFFVNDPDRIRSIGTRDWATVNLWGRWYHLRSRPTLQGDQSKTGLVEKTRLTKHWIDWVDYWAVDFDYLQRKEIIKVPMGSGLSGITSLPGTPQGELAVAAFDERWTGGYIFENEWQSFRTRQNRDLELTTPPHIYAEAGRYTVAAKVIDIFGNDTMTLVPVQAG